MLQNTKDFTVEVLRKKKTLPSKLKVCQNNLMNNLYMPSRSIFFGQMRLTWGRSAQKKLQLCGEDRAKLTQFLLKATVKGTSRFLVTLVDMVLEI